MGPNIQSTTPHIFVVNAPQPYAASYSSSYSVDPSINSAFTGMLRYYNSTLQYYDGMTWKNILQGTTSLGLTQESSNAIEWAINKQREENELRELAKSNPVIQGLVEEVEKAQRRLEVVANLVKENNA